VAKFAKMMWFRLLAIPAENPTDRAALHQNRQKHRFAARSEGPLWCVIIESRTEKTALKSQAFFGAEIRCIGAPESASFNLL
jgi:hypothetical protein